MELSVSSISLPSVSENGRKKIFIEIGKWVLFNFGTEAPGPLGRKHELSRSVQTLYLFKWQSYQSVRTCPKFSEIASEKISQAHVLCPSSWGRFTCVSTFWHCFLQTFFKSLNFHLRFLLPVQLLIPHYYFTPSSGAQNEVKCKVTSGN